MRRPTGWTDAPAPAAAMSGPTPRSAFAKGAGGRFLIQALGDDPRQAEKQAPVSHGIQWLRAVDRSRLLASGRSARILMSALAISANSQTGFRKAEGCRGTTAS